MKKKFSLIAFALLLTAVLFTACKNEKVIILNDNVSKTTLQEITAEQKTEKETTTILRCPITETTVENTCVVPETEPATDPVSDPTRVSTTCHPEVFINFLYKPEQIIFYHNGKPQTITKDIVMCDELIKIINKSTKNDRWGILKTAVDESYMERIRNENLCIEIYYDSTQLLNGLKGYPLDEYNFEKALIVLDGDDKNTMFFSKDGKYQSGPIRPYDSELSEEVLEYIFD